MPKKFTIDDNAGGKTLRGFTVGVNCVVESLKFRVDVGLYPARLRYQIVVKDFNDTILNVLVSS